MKHIKTFEDFINEARKWSEDEIRDLYDIISHKEMSTKKTAAKMNAAGHKVSDKDLNQLFNDWWNGSSKYLADDDGLWISWDPKKKEIEASDMGDI